MRRKLLSKTAGWLIAAFGGVHVIVAPYDTREVWRQVAAEGWWNTFTLDRAVTLEEVLRSEALWVTAGSFGVPLLALGCYILWSAHRHGHVPAWLGYLLLVYGGFTGIVLPASPIWAIAVAGLFIVIDNRDQGQDGSPAVAAAAHDGAGPRTDKPGDIAGTIGLDETAPTRSLD